MLVTTDMLKVHPVTTGEFKGGARDARLLLVHFFQFHAVFGEMVKIFDFASTFELEPPSPLGNRGSAPLDLHVTFVSLLQHEKKSQPKP